MGFLIWANPICLDTHSHSHIPTQRNTLNHTNLYHLQQHVTKYVQMHTSNISRKRSVCVQQSPNAEYSYKQCSYKLLQLLSPEMSTQCAITNLLFVCFSVLVHFDIMSLNFDAFPKWNPPSILCRIKLHDFDVCVWALEAQRREEKVKVSAQLFDPLIALSFL